MVPTNVIEEKKNHKLDLGCDFLQLGTFPVIWPFYQHVIYIYVWKVIGEEIYNVGN